GETRGSSGNKVNDREAEQIVTTVSRLVADSAYKNKTMGVISLLGSAQARLISDLLVRSLPAEELSRRQLRCGDAYAF
ncbi:C-terminal helicase domain-containing protein, partial [Klebsiella pneumoniae]|nr:C-terminal helicase domain-containing protein [Klebsiella pneumoniae]